MRQRQSWLNRARAAGVPDPEGDLRRLLRWAFDGIPEDERDDAQERSDLLDVALEARLRRQPVSQIVGSRAFWKGEFVVTPDVLDPRPETETLVARALGVTFHRLLDLGTGSGCLAVSLLAERPDARGVATDISSLALEVAGKNARAHGVLERLDLLQADWFDGVTGRFDLIVSNPPYIAVDEMPTLAPEVRDHEPRAALTDGADGLTAYRRIAADAPRHLAPGGRLLVEIGPTQAATVVDLFAAAGLDEIAVHPDLDGRDRVVEGRRGAP